MARVGTLLKGLWSRARINRYRKAQERSAKVDREAAERLDQLSEGIQSYGKPGPVSF